MVPSFSESSLISSSTSKYRDAAQKATAHLDMLESLGQVYADPACRSSLRAIAEDDGQEARDIPKGNLSVHVKRVLDYFHKYQVPEHYLPRKAQRRITPCGPCSNRRVKVSYYFRYGELFMTCIPTSVSGITAFSLANAARSVEY